MTLAQLRQELKARNPDYFSDTRANTLLNEAYHEVCEAYDWPFLETTTTGTAPLTISDLRKILYAVDTTTQNPLTILDPSTVVNQLDPIIGTVGTPTYFWLDQSVLKVYPTNTSVSLSVRYLKVPTDLSLDADTPILPTRYHLVIVDCAQARELAQGPNPNPSNLNRMNAIQANYYRSLDRMREALLNRSYNVRDFAMEGVDL